MIAPTRDERQFMDLYIREMHLGQYDGDAHRLSDERGITYDHHTPLEPAYMEYRGGAGNWGAPWPPLPDDPNLPCPWDSGEQIGARIADLASLSHSISMRLPNEVHRDSVARALALGFPIRW